MQLNRIQAICVAGVILIITAPESKKSAKNFKKAVA